MLATAFWAALLASGALAATEVRAPQGAEPSRPDRIPGLTATPVVSAMPGAGLMAAPAISGEMTADAAPFSQLLAAGSNPDALNQRADLGRAEFDGEDKKPAADVPAGPAAAPPARPMRSPTASKKRRMLRDAKAFVSAPLGLFRGRPSNDRDWSPDNATLAYAEFAGDKVAVHHVRNFKYRTAKDYTPAYYDAVYDLNGIEKVWYVVEPFSKRGLLAHTFVTFQFKDGRYLSISVEIRKVIGQSFSPWRGLFRNYELIYVVGDEKDVLGLRVNHRLSPVYLYPVKTERGRELLVDMLTRATALRDKPEFYNSIFNTCISNIRRHLNRISSRRFHTSLKILLPGLSDRLAYDLGLIDTDLPFDQARERFKVEKRAIKEDDPDFSRKIRKIP